MKIALRTRPVLALAAAVLILTGCGGTNPVRPSGPPPLRADWRVFTDVSWLPETSARPPMQRPELSVPTLDILRDGVWKLQGTGMAQVRLSGRGRDGAWKIEEQSAPGADRALSFGSGSSIVFRRGLAVASNQSSWAKPLEDGRVLVHTEGAAKANLAVRMVAYDVSGLEIRQLLRDANNQPEELAWYMSADEKFPRGSRAYLPTFWLGDDEVIAPSKTAFTGARTLEQLVRRFGGKHPPFCLSYIAHRDARPGALTFAPSARNARTGEFTLYPMDRTTNMCSKLSNLAIAEGSWRIGSVQGTRVMFLKTEPHVRPEDLGIQPVNAGAVEPGFAQVTRSWKGKGKRRTAVTSVIPVRVLRASRPITDFRLRFNETAARAVERALPAAQALREKDLAASAKKR